MPLFTQRELEYIELRYNQELPKKEVADRMKISLRTGGYFVERIKIKLGIAEWDQGCATIRIMRKLIRGGFINA
jgi:hypothetical protein